MEKEISVQDNKVLPVTRWLAILIVPVLVGAFIILYILPDRSGELFAWHVRPQITAMMLGAAYLGGAYFFTRAARTKDWHTMTLGLLPVSAFAGCMGLATVLHWDRFTGSPIAFALWVTLYFTLPFIIPVIWYRNQMRDPHQPDTDYPPFPLVVRRFLGGIGALLTVVSLLLFLLPDTMIPAWAWELTPLTARVTAAMFILSGIVGIGIARDGRWTAARYILEAQIGSIILILIAVVLSSENLDWGQLASWMFAGGMTLLCAVLIGIYLWMERQRRA